MRLIFRRYSLAICGCGTDAIVSNSWSLLSTNRCNFLVPFEAEYFPIDFVSKVVASPFTGKYENANYYYPRCRDWKRKALLGICVEFHEIIIRVLFKVAHTHANIFLLFFSVRLWFTFDTNLISWSRLTNSYNDGNNNGYTPSMTRKKNWFRKIAMKLLIKTNPNYA